MSITKAQHHTQPNKKWWKNSIIYEIYPRSFQDSNNDGIGDLEGVRSRLDYFTFLGIDSIWLTPIYCSPMKDFGYDISDFTDIDPLFGTVDNFKHLLFEAHSKNIKVILDFVPNHSSNQHRWFNQSCQGVEPYRDYYVWRDGVTLSNGKIGPPNNWLSEFGGSAWTWNSQRSQFYYHAFLKEQPDLNYENPKVLEEMKNVLRFWLDLGVDGFRMDAVNHLHEDQQFLDEPVNEEGSISASKDEYNYLEHIYVAWQPKTAETIGEFVKVVREYETDPSKVKAVMVEDYNHPSHLMVYYDVSKVDYPFNFDFVSLNDLKSLGGGVGAQKIIENWMSYMRPPTTPKQQVLENRVQKLDLKSQHDNDKNINGQAYEEFNEDVSSSTIDYSKRWPNWVTSNHDRSRFGSRFGPAMIDAFHMLILLLPGTPTVYYGDELGMLNIDVPPFTQTQDSFALNMGPERYKLYTRDPERSPMQWDSSHMAGFTESNASWLPISPESPLVNVETETADPASHLNIFRALVALRKETAFRDNIDIHYGAITKNIISFSRIPKNYTATVKENKLKGYFIIINVGRESENYPLHLHPRGIIPTDTPLTIILATRTIQLNSNNTNIKINASLTFPACDIMKSVTEHVKITEPPTLNESLQANGKELASTTINNDLAQKTTLNPTFQTLLPKNSNTENSSKLVDSPTDALSISLNELTSTTSQQQNNEEDINDDGKINGIVHKNENGLDDKPKFLFLKPGEGVILSWII